MRGSRSTGGLRKPRPAGRPGMDESYTIRRATVADADQLAAIERVCFSDPWTPAGIEETIQYETALALVAENPAGVAGYIMKVRESNAAAINLYQSAGFRTVGLRPRY